MPASGIITIVTSGVGKALLTGDATLLPTNFDGVAAHEVHEVLVSVLMMLVILHVHQAPVHHERRFDGEDVVARAKFILR